MSPEFSWGHSERKLSHTVASAEGRKEQKIVTDRVLLGSEREVLFRFGTVSACNRRLHEIRGLVPSGIKIAALFGCTRLFARVGFDRAHLCRHKRTTSKRTAKRRPLVARHVSWLEVSLRDNRFAYGEATQLAQKCGGDSDGVVKKRHLVPVSRSCPITELEVAGRTRRTPQLWPC